MKLFERPIAELIAFSVEDVITTSGEEEEEEIAILDAMTGCF